MKIKYNLLIIGIVLLLIFSLVSVNAAFTPGSVKSSIQSEYSSGEKIQGWINISFNSENTKSEIKDSFGNKINLLDFLKNQNGISYSCNPQNCEDYYSYQGSGVETKSFTLGSDKVVGVLLNGKNVEISKFEFSGNSDASASCSEQLTIDLLDNNKNNWANTKYLSESCGSDLRSNCFNNLFNDVVSISKVPYCEKIRLVKSPSFEVKTSIRKNAGSSTFSSGLLKGWIYDSDGDLKGSCDLNNPSNSFNYVSCIINYQITEAGDYYTCVSYDEAAVNPQGYELQARLSGSYCGFLGDPAQTGEFNGDYNIVVSSKKFNSISGFRVNETSFIGDEDGLINYMNTYLNNKYSKDCSGSGGCIIPIRFSGIGQSINLNGLYLEYSAQGSAGTISKNFYDITKEESKVSSSFLKLDLLKADFSTPTNKGDYNYELFINGNSFDKKDISVSGEKEKIVLGLYPKTVAVAADTTFTVFLDQNINSTGIKLSWDFGDNSQEVITSNNKIKHIYPAIGNYTLSVKAFRGDQEISTTSFNIVAKSPKESINETLTKYKKDISNFETQFNGLNQDYKDIINDNYQDLNEIKGDISSIETSYKALLLNSGSTDQDYVNVMNSLNGLHVPLLVQTSQKSNIKYIYDVDEIDLEEVVRLFNEYYPIGQDEEYRQAISEWFIKNIDASLDHEVISIYYDDSIVDVISEFNLEIESTHNYDGDFYVIIGEDIDNIIIDNTYDRSLDDGYVGIKFSDLKDSKKLKFSTQGGVDVFEIPIVIVPKLNQLNVVSDGENDTESKTSFWSVFVPSIIVLLILALVIYVLLQQWYKRKYESHIFKSKNDLYNLIIFIRNAKSKKLSDKQIHDQLKKSGWKSEQIDYALKKSAGKNTGLWEIPLITWFEKRKINKELSKQAKPRQAF